MGVVAVSLPEVPVMVTAAIPGLTELLAVSVIKLELVAGFGEKVAVTPLGSPDAARLTPLVNPYWGKTLTVDVAVLPSFILRI
jgi:hypothetical protein